MLIMLLVQCSISLRTWAWTSQVERSNNNRRAGGHACMTVHYHLLLLMLMGLSHHEAKVKIMSLECTAKFHLC